VQRRSRRPPQMITIGGNQQVGEFVGELMLPDEWVSQQRPEHSLPATRNSRLQRQLLVRRDVGDQACVQRINWRECLSDGAVPADTGRHFDSGMVSKKGERAVI